MSDNQPSNDPPPYYPLPRDVVRAVKAHTASNFGLLFHRLIGYHRRWEMKGEEKASVWKEQVVRHTARIFRQINSSNLLTNLQARQARIKKGYEQLFGPNNVVSFSMSVDWRLAIGFSSPSVLDTGIALHRIYGIPYLPGSAIKGLTRHYRLTSIAEKLGVAALDPDEIDRRRKEKEPSQGTTPWEMLERLLMAEESINARQQEGLKRLFDQLAADRALLDGPVKKKELLLKDLRSKGEYDAQAFRHAFGSTVRRGEVIFFDAFPQTLIIQENHEEKPILELDIINTHYQAYYTGNPPAPPADYLNPVPVYFLAVRAGTRFQFYLAARDQNLLKTVTGWVEDALKEDGIGAKTRAGYGAMKV